MGSEGPVEGLVTEGRQEYQQLDVDMPVTRNTSEVSDMLYFLYEKECCRGRVRGCAFWVRIVDALTGQWARIILDRHHSSVV